ncbi:MAG: oxidoreductase [Alphaproteobacteria bacterium]|nr:oxidoreductase [Alphaproteobacteria bacterium]|tara:strand:- start:272 stop:1063 length:792 start_codon:yes stop_codon:yes gene_type:complete
MDLELKGKRALVTGSTLGIGRAIAETLEAEGAQVIINGRDEDRVAKAAGEIAGDVSGCAADLSTAAGAQTLAEFAVAGGPIDILVNNAGMFTVKEFFDTEDDDWQAMFELNVMSAVRLSRALMPAMLDSGSGRVVFIGSDQSSKPNPSMAHYAMTKTALVSIARSLAERTRGTDVTVNTVQVAPTWTDGVDAFMHQMAEIEDTTPEEMSKAYFAEGEGQTSLLERWARPEEIAAFVAFLCSSQASAINGSAPRADGGMVRALF